MKPCQLALACLLAVMVGQAQDVDVRYAPVPSWVVPMQPHAVAGARSDGALHFTYSDFQVMSNGAGTEEYTAYRVKLLRPDALVMGNINLTWMPDSGAATVHHVRIIRDGQVIDVLKDTKFAVFQPPNTIEQAILSGTRVANLQVPGLRVGDELEFAATVRYREIALPDHSYGVTQVANTPASGSFRIRMMWPDGQEPAWRVSSDITGQLRKQSNAVEVQLDDPTPLQLPADAPARFAFRRALEFSDFKTWRDLSATLAPLYGDAAQLPPDSPVKALASQMKAASADPMSRARAALQLVQDDVRYVYVGMNGGNLVPAKAETTWERRYGDCKGKTVLLMALLAEMGIASRPVVVSTGGGDGLDRHLPIPQFFDHVLVQAELGGKWYWLDGTRSGDLRIRTEPPDFYKWVLPLTREGTEISAVPFLPLDQPETLEVLDIDLRAGVDKPARITVQQIIRGNRALAMRAALASLSTAQAESQLKQMMSARLATVESSRWAHDAESATLLISTVGTAMVEWNLLKTSIAGAGFYPPDVRRRADDRDGGVPWHNDPHFFSCYATTMELPKAMLGRAWSYDSKAMDQVIGGVAYWRMAQLKDNTMRTVAAKRTMRDEISSEDAEVANRLIPGFDNAQSRVGQALARDSQSGLSVADKSIKEVPTATNHDWLRDASPCIAPRLRH